MGERGPMPNRSDARRRTNATSESGESMEVTKVYVDPDELDDVSAVGAPPANEDWHDGAVAMYESFKRSAMRGFYEPTDWQTIYMLCDQLSRHLTPQVLMGPEGAVLDSDGEPMMRVIPMPGSTMSALLKGFANVGATEGDRRRLKIEVERSGEHAKGAAPTGANVLEFRQSRLG